MPRALVIVLDSVGIGGAEDAAAYGDAGADTLGHIAEACAHGEGDRDGLRSGPLRLPHLAALGIGLACEASTGRMPPNLKPSGAVTGAWGYGVETSKGKDTPSGHWEIAGVPVAFGWGYFPNTQPAFPRDLTEALVREARPAGHPRRQARLRHRHPRRARRRAHADGQADLLHLGRQRLPDRRARGNVRAGAALRALPHGAPPLRSAQDRPGHRPALRR